jgi:hypothetical protein
MDKPTIAYTSRPDATPETELDALAAICAFALECHENRKAADLTGDRNEAKEVKNVGPKQSLPQ